MSDHILTTEAAQTLQNEADRDGESMTWLLMVAGDTGDLVAQPIASCRGALPYLLGGATLEELRVQLPAGLTRPPRRQGDPPGLWRCGIAPAGCRAGDQPQQKRRRRSAAKFRRRLSGAEGHHRAASVSTEAHQLANRKNVIGVQWYSTKAIGAFRTGTVMPEADKGLSDHGLLPPVGTPTRLNRIHNAVAAGLNIPR